jgi:ubiquinone/menaquinone biosynthesis C-methylase UbiE
VSRSIRETLRRADLRAGARVLDVGCGSGALVGEAQRRHSPSLAVAVDLSLAMIAAAKEHRTDGAQFLVGDAENLPLEAAQFDAVFSTSSFHFWPNRQRALREIHRVMRRNGRLVITDWCDDFLACRLCDALLHWRDPSRPHIASRDDCATLLAESGFRVLSIDQYKISWLWGLMTAVATKTSVQ